MILVVPNEYKSSKKVTALTVVIVVIVMIAISYSIINVIAVPFGHYYGTGSNVVDGNGNPADKGAPDYVYQQKDWGWFDNSSRTWSFAMCDHDYLGPLHGIWKVADGVWVPVTGQAREGIYPIDAKLWLTVQNNTIVHCEITSDLEYGANSSGWSGCPGPFNLISILPYIVGAAAVVSLAVGLYIVFKKPSPVTIEKTDDGKV